MKRTKSRHFITALFLSAIFLLTISVSYTADGTEKKLGKLLADSVVEVVVNGKAVKDVPVKMDSHPKIHVCRDKIKL